MIADPLGCMGLMLLFPALVVRDTPVPEGFKLKVNGVVKARVFPNWDAAYDAAIEARYDDYEIVESDRYGR